ncbi:MAG TPA: acetylglutamate kinase [Dehalococcoidia bacterium]|nr:acetylglutamate kinase [Dehalococcoidia bacterium]
MRPTLVKVGGSTLGSHDTTLDDLAGLHRAGRPLVVVHGGGKTITDWLGRMQIESRIVKGLRVTDEAGLEVVVAVLAGLVNKTLVGGLAARGAKAFGLAGADATFRARIGRPELGLVGDVSRVEPEALGLLLSAGFLPVVAPVGLADDGSGQLLNINADTAAGDLAAGIDAEYVAFLTDVEGVKDEAGRVIDRLSRAEAEELMARGVASGGMIPKLQACLHALSPGRRVAIVDGRQPGALGRTIAGEPVGTVITE